MTKAHDKVVSKPSDSEDTLSSQPVMVKARDKALMTDQQRLNLLEESMKSFYQKLKDFMTEVYKSNHQSSIEAQKTNQFNQERLEARFDNLAVRLENRFETLVESMKGAGPTTLSPVHVTPLLCLLIKRGCYLPRDTENMVVVVVAQGHQETWET